MLPLVMALALVAAPESPEPAIPRFDVDADCASVSRGSPAIRNRCIENEQLSYDAARAVWGDLAPRNRRYCLSNAEASRVYKYRVLASCAVPRAERDRLDQPHRFQY